MITVSIGINGNAIMTRSAWRVKGEDDELCEYKTDAGNTILHNPKDGPKVLAKKMLDTIKEE